MYPAWDVSCYSPEEKNPYTDFILKMIFDIAFQKEKALIGLYELIILESYTFFKYIQTLIGLYQLTE